jgi:hypothetical protein
MKVGDPRVCWSVEVSITELGDIESYQMNLKPVREMKFPTLEIIPIIFSTTGRKHPYGLSQCSSVGSRRKNKVD